MTEAEAGSIRSGGLAKRKKERTRRQIVEAAAELMRERGYHLTTVDDICQDAEVAPRTFFRYFPTKEDLVVAFGEIGAEDLFEALRRRPLVEPLHTSLVEALTHLKDDEPQDPAEAAKVRSFLRVIYDNPPLRARWLGEAHRQQERLAAIVAPRIGEPAGSVRAALVAAAIVLALHVAMERWALDDTVDNPNGLIVSVLDELTTALLPTA